MVLNMIHSGGPPSPSLPVVSIIGQVQLGPYEQHLLVEQDHTAVVHHTCEAAAKAGRETQHYAT
jgi:hypothetical protein